MKKQLICLLLLFLVAIQTVEADYFFTDTGSLNSAREYFTATLLTNGQVLVVGGWCDSGITNSVELYNPSNASWMATGNLNTARYGHTATLLNNGQVLVTSGTDSNGDLTASAELFNPSTGTWTNTGTLNHARWGHTATLLYDGHVLVAGGDNDSDAIASAEIYNPVTGTWTNTGSMTTKRFYHTATLLNNEQVLVAAGATGSITASAELYNPIIGSWTNTGTLNEARYEHSATLLPNGKVLVAGGDYINGQSSELYDPITGKWTNTGSLNVARYSPAATLIPNGKVLIVGCDAFTSKPPTAQTELYDPIAGTWAYTGAMDTGREKPTATLLNNGQVLVAAGSDGTNYLSSSELYSSNVLPLISGQPQPLTVTNGHTASFIVTATGLPALSYQWFFNSTNLVNSTNSTLTLQNAYPSNAGAYTVAIANTYGSVTSNPAMLTVLPLGITSPMLLSSGQFQFSFDTASGMNYAVQYSTNLTQWFPFVTLGGIGVPLTLIDPNSASSQQRFYRIVLSPQ